MNKFDLKALALVAMTAALANTAEVAQQPDEAFIQEIATKQADQSIDRYVGCFDDGCDWDTLAPPVQRA